jgi:hypothetical protein
MENELFEGEGAKLGEGGKARLVREVLNLNLTINKSEMENGDILWPNYFGFIGFLYSQRGILV